MSWSPADIPPLTGRTAVVTGVSVGGLGHFTALELARAGARVVLAGRNPEKLAGTEDTIRAEVPEAALERLVVDLSDLASVRSAAGEAASYGQLDLLVNNAGVMAPPYRRTVDGFESQLATNHLGPFLLTGLLLPQLATDARVVTVASLMHRFARKAPLGDPRVKARPYLRWIAYSQTKLANLLFTFELDRRLRRRDRPPRPTRRIRGTPAPTWSRTAGSAARAVGSPRSSTRRTGRSGSRRWSAPGRR